MAKPAWVATVLAVVAISSGCQAIDGGAAELTWSLRTPAGEPIGACGDVPLKSVRLCWNAAEEDSHACDQEGVNFRDFACREETGITGFEIPPGPTRFFVKPICLDGEPADASTYQVPSDIVRTISDGQIVTLDALLLVVTDSADCTSNCTCQR